MVDFAPQYERLVGDDPTIPLIDFPNDMGRRNELFPPNCNRHPAKANLYLIGSLVEYLTAPGFKILDPMTGSGTIFIAATMERHVVAIDIEPFFIGVQNELLDGLELWCPDIRERVTQLQGNAEKLLPIPVQCCIFSPPYGPIMTKSQDKVGNWGSDLVGELYGDSFVGYCKTEGNVGKLNEFMYTQHMEKVYAGIAKSLPLGGCCAVIIKDSIKGAKRFYRSKQVTRIFSGLGMPLWEWYKWPALGTAFTKIYRSQGLLTVDEEDILIYKKEVL